MFVYFTCINRCLSFSLISGLPFGPGTTRKKNESGKESKRKRETKSSRAKRPRNYRGKLQCIVYLSFPFAIEFAKIVGSISENKSNDCTMLNLNKNS